MASSSLYNYYKTIVSNFLRREVFEEIFCSRFEVLSHSYIFHPMLDRIEEDCSYQLIMVSHVEEERLCEIVLAILVDLT
jgi:hypothetical protein